MSNVKQFDFSHLSAQSASLKGLRRDKGFYSAVSLVGLLEGKIKALAEIRYYRTPATNYACFWLHSPILGLYGQSGGKASGYGYGREEAARRIAAEAHGIVVNGWCDERLLLESFAEYLGVKTYEIIKANA